MAVGLRLCASVDVMGIAELIVAVVAVGVTIWGGSRRATVKADAKIDLTNFISVVVQAGRNSVTVLSVRAVVPERPGKKPGDSAIVLNVSDPTFAGSVQLDAKQSKLFGLTLKMDTQMLPTSDGSAQELRPPNRDEIWVRIDYGKKAKIFVKAEPFDGVLEQPVDGR
jgi:hypothetical protein